jgi:hypothetical protein
MEVRLRHLSPIATDALRRNTRIQQQQKTLVVGRTVARFIGQGLADVDSLLDGVITQEIPYAGATSASVKRLRKARAAVRAVQSGRDAMGVHDEMGIDVTVLPDRPVTLAAESPDRVRLLDLLAELYEGGVEKGWYETAELAELVTGNPLDQDVPKERFRAWLASRL